jgi:hypothetical protein
VSEHALSPLMQRSGPNDQSPAGGAPGRRCNDPTLG